jgi:hypothetical protein
LILRDEAYWLAPTPRPQGNGYRLLSTLADRIDGAVTRNDPAQYVWGYEEAMVLGAP